MTRKNIFTKIMLRRGNICHAHIQATKIVLGIMFSYYIFSIRKENGVCQVVISAQACTTFILLYFCHFHLENKGSRKQSNHVACRAPTPYQRSGM
jgi:hypothetical protein